MQPKVDDISTNKGSRPLYTAILSRRTIRRFQQRPISQDMLKKMIEGARLAPSAANLQPLEYLVITNPALLGVVFDSLKWAAYITPPWKPDVSQRPVAYVIILVHKDTSFEYKWDVGFAAAHIILVAESEQIGSCFFENVNRNKLHHDLHIPETFLIDGVIALGYKDEVSIIEEYTTSVKYWRDSNNVLHVPKKNLKDILHFNSL